MKTRLILFIWLFSIGASAQTISGNLVDQSNKNPIIYGTITLVDTAGKFVSGTLTDVQGSFILKPAKTGNFMLNCSFMGYQTWVKPIMINQDKIDLGTILLTPNAQQLNEVTITGQQPILSLQPDKKIYAVGKDVLSQNGSVSDALNSIPSVMVSPQGEVSLRGNTGVTVLINGRQSGLTQGSALEQLQADQIERIEIITSPSSRYDAAGNAGIINIILKKNKKAGFNGQLKTVLGVPNDTRINPSLNYKSNKFNFFSTLGMRKSDYKGIYTTDQVTNQNSMQSIQNENRHDDGKMLYLGADYYISSKSTMTAAYLWNGTHDHDKTELNYNYYSNKPDSLIRRNGESWEQRNYHQLEYNFTQLFARPKQKWTVDLQYDWWDSNKDWQLATRKLMPLTFNYPALRTNAFNTNRDLLIQSDWAQPIGEETLLEMGIKTENRHVAYDFLAEQEANGNYVVYKNLDNGLNYNERIQSAYAQIGGKINKFRYLGGLRLELTAVNALGRDGLNSYLKNYAKLFPTLHLDYAFTNAAALQLHYSRRIGRPSLYQLSPYMELSDLNVQSTGNPDLNPAYSNLYELGFIYQNSTLTLNPSFYVQQTDSPIADYTFRNTDEIFITMPINIAHENHYGLELNAMYSPLKVLQFNADFNWYYFNQSGTYQNFDFDFSGSSSFARIGAQWKITKTLSAQGRYYYNGASSTAQSRTHTMHWADFGISKNLLTDRLSIVADVTNAFDSRRYLTTTTGQDYVLATMSRFNGARYRLSVVYKFKRNATVREAKSGNRD